MGFAPALAGGAAVVGLYALFAQSFPGQVAIDFGRGGSATGPIIAGFLFAAGASLPNVALLMALGSVIAAASLTFLYPDRRSDSAASQQGSE